MIFTTKRTDFNLSRILEALSDNIDYLHAHKRVDAWEAINLLFPGKKTLISSKTVEVYRFSDNDFTFYDNLYAGRLSVYNKEQRCILCIDYDEY